MNDIDILGFDTTKWSKEINETLQNKCHWLFVTVDEPEDVKFNTGVGTELPKGMTYNDFFDLFYIIVKLYEKHGTNTLSELRGKLGVN